MSNPYTIIAILEAKQDKVDELQADLVSITKQSRKENSCLGYRLHRNLANPNEFVLYETWQNEALHEEQFQKPYINDLLGKLDSLLAKPFQIIAAEEMLPVIAEETVAV